MAADVEPGRLVGGRYRVVGALGADPAGRVWRAYDERLLVDVAVKQLVPAEVPADVPADADAAEVRGRAARQAGRAARLRDHPHIVAVHDVVIDGDELWTVMQLVEGTSLRDQLDAYGPLSVDRVADVARAMLKALAAAYAADVVHFNVTPGNVMLTGDGGVLLTDFLAPAGGRIGTPGYIAPERTRGDDAGGAGDLFSLGVTLYQALEGEVPFAADDSAMYAGPPPIRRCGRLAPLVTRLLDPDPERRPTADQALALLDPPRDAVRFVGWQRPAAERKPAAFVFEGHTGQVRAVAFSPDGLTIASGGDDQAVRLWDLTSGSVSHTRLTDHTDWIRAVAFSPDGTLLASGGDDKAIRLWDITTGLISHTRLTGHTGWVRALAFSPDGTTLASGGGDKVVRLWDVVSGSNTATLSGHTGWIRALAFSPDGTTLATGGSDKRVRLWDVASGKSVATWPSHCRRVYAVAFSPDGTTLATAGGKSGVRMWDTATREQLPAWPGVGEQIRSLAFSPDGRTLATGAMHRKVTLWDTTTASSTDTWTSTYGEARSVAFSPDGMTLAGGDTTTVRLWYTSR